LDVRGLSGFNAADANSNIAFITYLREYLARVKVFVDIISDKQPRSVEKT
jgi:SanA protein